MQQVYLTLFYFTSLFYFISLFILFTLFHFVYQIYFISLILLVKVIFVFYKMLLYRNTLIFSWRLNGYVFWNIALLMQSKAKKKKCEHLCQL